VVNHELIVNGGVHWLKWQKVYHVRGFLMTGLKWQKLHFQRFTFLKF